MSPETTCAVVLRLFKCANGIILHVSFITLSQRKMNNNFRESFFFFSPNGRRLETQITIIKQEDEETPLSKDPMSGQEKIVQK